MNDDEDDNMHDFFTAHIIDRQNKLRASGTKIVHYTRAETLLSILSGKEFWMRNTQCMNDYQEVEFGIEQILSYFGNHDKSGKFWELIDKTHSGISAEIKENFDGWLHDLRIYTYITCLSEHVVEEDSFGRLSMWRAYGGAAGVAIVINPEVMLRESDALKAYSYPVFYFGPDEMRRQCDMFVDSLVLNASAISRMDRSQLSYWIFFLFQSYAFCLKHPGFREEKEWRVVYRPNYESSSHIKSELRSVGGVPQKIYKIPLKDIPEEDFFGAELNALVDKVIIGPCEHPITIYTTIVEALQEAGVTDPANRVRISSIPLRT